ncbi:unnamed protein product [Moneuplotes crassus]|uniref:CUB domain-containing protein n=1 Tax=Euplotes crassus TaxID=5936 RepID=A0AAD1Y690_EUPCR|nr:unnamed protein product [Moneuplotes crassus]
MIHWILTVMTFLFFRSICAADSKPSCVKCLEDLNNIYCKRLNSNQSGFCASAHDQLGAEYKCSDEYSGNSSSNQYFSCDFDQDECGTQNIAVTSSHTVSLSGSPKHTICRYNFFLKRENNVKELKIFVSNLESTKLDILEQISVYEYNLIQSIHQSDSLTVNVTNLDKITIMVIPKRRHDSLISFTVSQKGPDPSFWSKHLVLIIIVVSLACCGFCSFIVYKISKVEFEERNASKIVPENTKRRNPISSILDGSREVVNFDPLSVPDIELNPPQHAKYMNNGVIISIAENINPNATATTGLRACRSKIRQAIYLV